MQTIKALYRLTRPFNALTGALAVLLGGYVAGTGRWGEVALAGLVTMLVTAAGNAFNDYLDIEIDRVNQPQRVLPAGLIRPRHALVFALALALLALAAAAFINRPAFLVALFAVVALAIYSWKLKSTVLMGNATVAAVSALSAIFGGIAAGHVLPTFWLALIIATAIMGREVLKTLADYEGDLRQRCRTIATAWGRRPARIAFYLLAAATTWIMMLPYLLRVYRPVYATIVAIGVYPVILYALLKVWRYSTGPQLERVSQIMKLDFLVWFAAVIVGAGR